MKFVDPRGRPTVTADSDHCFCTCSPSVCPHFSKQNKVQVKTMIATGETLGLAKWIIDDTCLVIFSWLKILHYAIYNIVSIMSSSLDTFWPHFLIKSSKSNADLFRSSFKLFSWRHSDLDLQIDLLCCRLLIFLDFWKRKVVKKSFFTTFFLLNSLNEKHLTSLAVNFLLCQSHLKRDLQLSCIHAAKHVQSINWKTAIWLMPMAFHWNY